VFDEENAVITTVDSNEAEIKLFEEFDTKMGKLYAHRSHKLN